MGGEYKARVIDGFIAEVLDSGMALLLEGPRACGKSVTGRFHAQSFVNLDTDVDAVRLGELNPELLLTGRYPRFIDEWQLLPSVWNHVRRHIDDRQDEPVLLAGSATPADDATRHSGAGRILRTRMRTMSLSESGQSSGDVSLGHLLDNPAEKVSGISTLSVSDIAETIIRGGWPGLLTQSTRSAQRILSSYLDDVARVDLARLAGEPARDPRGVRRAIESIARHVGTEASLSAIARDASTEHSVLKYQTIGGYLGALERVFIMEDQPSWGPHLRSRSRIRGAPKRHFVDPSLSTAALGASPDRLLKDLEYFGQLFESLVVRDLRVYSGTRDATVRHFRDDAGREADAIIEHRDGSWAAIEVKLASSHEDEAAISLTRFVDAIDTKRTSPPTTRIIVTGGKYAYTRKDGIHVVPLGALAP